MRYPAIWVLLWFLTVFAVLGEGYRILCVFPFNGKSHYMMFGALCKEFAKRGHSVDMISHFPSKTPPTNYTDIVDLSGTRESVVNSFSIEFAKTLQGSLTYSIAQIYGNELCELLGIERMQKFIKNPPKNPPYDLVITEFFGANCYFGFGNALKVPVIAAVSSMDQPYISENMGNPLNYAFYSGAFVDIATITTFWDRVWNFVVNFKECVLFYHYTAIQTEIMRKYLGQDLPTIRDVEKSVALTLVNTHYSFHGIRPITPAVVEVGGLHILADESKLTPELNAWLDSAEDGVVYFTLGSLINIETLPVNTLLELYKSFGKISPVRVLMKCADKTKLPLGLPSNMLTSSWIPQIPVLHHDQRIFITGFAWTLNIPTLVGSPRNDKTNGARYEFLAGHKNTRIFITHGGLMGSQEALYYGVPMIGIPVFADQAKNVNIFVEKNMAIRMNIEEINERTLDTALDALLNDSKYRESAKKHSALFKERPMSAMDTAVYWVEYVIRNGANSLRSPAMDMPWWQLHMVDVFAFLIASLIIIIYSLVMLVRYAFRKSRRGNPTDNKKRD